VPVCPGLDCTYRVDSGYMGGGTGSLSATIAGTLGTEPLRLVAAWTTGFAAMAFSGNLGADAIGATVSFAPGGNADAFRVAGALGPDRVALSCPGAHGGHVYRVSGTVGGVPLDAALDADASAAPLQHALAAIEKWAKDNYAKLAALSPAKRRAALDAEIGRLATYGSPWFTGTLDGRPVAVSSALPATVIAGLVVGSAPAQATNGPFRVEVGRGSPARSDLAVSMSPSVLRGRISGTLSGPPLALLAGIGWYAASLITETEGIGP